MAGRYQSGVIKTMHSDGVSGIIQSDSGLLLPFKLAEEVRARGSYISGSDIKGRFIQGDKVTFTVGSTGNADNIKKPLISRRSYTQVAHGYGRY